jgi:LmbE family N-acetylglucosaminyl deacetylase
MGLKGIRFNWSFFQTMQPTLLVLYAHPDDESASSGTIAKAISLGWRVVLICATRGEEGEISDPSLATPENLWEVREGELLCAAKVLGIDEVHFLDYCDSGMAGTLPNQNPKSFMQADPKQVITHLIKLIRQIRPHTMMTFEPYGIYGHPDHIAISKFATEAFRAAGQESNSPELGLPWKTKRLFYTALSSEWFRRLRNNMADLQLDTSGFESLAQFLKHENDRAITHTLNLREFVTTKVESLRCHQTQIGPNTPFYHLLKPEFGEIQAEEMFIQKVPSSPIEDIFSF